MFRRLLSATQAAAYLVLIPTRFCRISQRLPFAVPGLRATVFGMAPSRGRAVAERLAESIANDHGDGYGVEEVTVEPCPADMAGWLRYFPEIEDDQEDE